MVANHEVAGSSPVVESFTMNTFFVSAQHDKQKTTMNCDQFEKFSCHFVLIKSYIS